jgi:large subunit ribosomal protein L19
MANSITIKNTLVHIGDTIKIYYKFKESDKFKEQIFSGILIAVKGSGINKMFTVRKGTKDKIGVERIFPINSPYINKVSISKKGLVRRAKIYFIRNLSESELRHRLS